MARKFNPTTLKILELISKQRSITIDVIKDRNFTDGQAKSLYNLVFRLKKSGLVEEKEGRIYLSSEGQELVSRQNPARDGKWKILIYDIPEKDKFVRNVLRTKLKQLHFKKWQNSIWVTPFKLEPEIEQELEQLAKRYFVRLITADKINVTADIEKLFA